MIIDVFEHWIPDDVKACFFNCRMKFYEISSEIRIFKLMTVRNYLNFASLRINFSKKKFFRLKEIVNI